ncbi:ATP12 family chaperone protein [Rhodopila sp.]|uniref:ATP12 family chaperone protein n=1 Tax=Rhodopila sp. TaxID=2480087 RepID=UPI003D0EB8E7
MKRFWDSTEVHQTENGHTILLDGKPMRLPGGSPLLVAKPRLAQAIAAEWQAAGGAKGGQMSFKDTPLTRLAGTALDRIAPDPAITIDAIARYGETDLLCYRAETPQALVRRQCDQWQHWLDWAERIYGARLRVVTGVGYLGQHHDSIAALRQAVAALDVDTLAGLGIAVPALGSLILGLALAAQQLDAQTAHALGALDELFQAEQWGDDDEAVGRRAAVLADIVLASRYIDLTRGDQ